VADGGPAAAGLLFQARTELGAPESVSNAMDRRRVLATFALGVTAALPSPPAAAAAPRRPIGRGGLSAPLIGMGTWLTFDVGDAVAERERRAQVLDAFFAAGGGMIDSSPMYGRAERVVGDLLARRGGPGGGELFSATKIWTPFDRSGPRQVTESLALWRLPRLDLVHVHNLLNWRVHLKTLRAMKEAGRVRSIGVTTSHGRRHDEMLDVIRREPLDAIQITYSVADDSAEPVVAAAAERGIAVIANRPFDGGSLVDRANRVPLPPWIGEELDCTHWSQALLKWIVSHPAVSCAIPATTDPAHMAQNMAAAHGRMPDATQRRRIAETLRRSL
jgi:diketogulonate reductase-like aldo/keto reductase